jgi:hypothetical protein
LCAKDVRKGRHTVEEYVGRFWLSTSELWNELHDPFHEVGDFLDERVHEFYH